MPAFPTLSEQDRWAVAFHLFTLRQPRVRARATRASLEFLANATDAELGRGFGAESWPACAGCSHARTRTRPWRQPGPASTRR